MKLIHSLNDFKLDHPECPASYGSSCLLDKCQQIFLLHSASANFLLAVRNTPSRSCYVTQCHGLYVPSLRPGTHYPHVTWAHVMLRVRLGC